MGLTPEERKERMKKGRPGRFTSVARRTKRTLGHVSQVVAGLRPDSRVEKEVARRFGMDVETVFPEYHAKRRPAA